MEPCSRSCIDGISISDICRDSNYAELVHCLRLQTQKMVSLVLVLVR